jgi:hypothetical protein
MDPLQDLQAETGGRPAANDDLLVLQNRDAALGLPALLAGLGPCVVSGCRVYQTGTVWNVGPGMVWDGASLLPFSGRSNVSFPAMFGPGAVVVVDERAYQDGTTKATIKSQNMDLLAPVAGAPNLVIDTTGALTFWQRVQERTREVGVVEYITDLAGYDGTGLGTGPKLGWALCNGQNGTVDLRGQFVAVHDPARTDYSTVGKTGGAEMIALTVGQMPNHGHTSNNRISKENKGDAGSYTAALTGSFNADGKLMSSQAAGGGEAHENRPPFYVLAARQWRGF